MRRSTSSSCLLRPKSEVDLAQLDEQLSVTLLNTRILPTYSTERFYMLSELERMAHSTVFLCDHHDLVEQEDDCDQTLGTVESSEASIAEPPSITPPSAANRSTTTASSSLPPPHVILYLLWRQEETTRSPRAFADETIQAAVKRLKHYLDNHNNHTSSSSSSEKEDHKTPVYLVLDTMVPSLGSEEEQDARERRFQMHLQIAEQLARHVAQSLRNDIQGITVGVADHVRAAPGLEACLEAVQVGSGLRRRQQCKGGSKKSLLQLAVPHPDDLLGRQDQNVTDAAQGVRQCRVCAEWNGLGNLQSFARRAHKAWCKQNQVLLEENHEETRMTNRRNRKTAAGWDEGLLGADPICTMIFLLVFTYVLLSLWSVYGEALTDYWNS